jgi:hypothetical protein
MSDIFVEEKFAAKVSFSDDPWACWEWTGGTTPNGHASYYVSATQSTVPAARLAFEWAKRRKIRPGLLVRHTCDNPRCVHPHHLVEGTHSDNMWDMRMRGRTCTKASGRHYSVHTPEAVLRLEKNGNSKLTCPQVEKIRDLRRQGRTYQSLADEFGMSRSGIGAIIRGINWASLPTDSPYVSRLTPPAAKLNYALAAEIRSLRSDGASTADLARRYTVSESTINTVCRGATWKEETITDG